MNYVLICLINSIGEIKTLGVREFLGRMVQKILDSSSSFEHEQIGVVKLWKIFPVFAQEKGKNLTKKKSFELYEVQWSKLLHL